MKELKPAVKRAIDRWEKAHKVDCKNCKLEEFVGNQNNQPQGIRAILVKRNEAVMKEYLELKKRWQNEEITKEQLLELNEQLNEIKCAVKSLV